MNTSVAIESRFAPHRMRRLIGQFFSSRGFLETMNMSLTQPSYYKGLDVADPAQWVTIHNTSNESVNLLRPEMIVPTLETIRRNVNRKQEDLRLYEFGNSYLQNDGQPKETEHLVITLVGRQQPVHWENANNKTVDFFSIKSEVNALLSRIGITKWKTTKCENEPGLDYGLIYSTDFGLLVRFGKVTTSWCHKFDIRQPVFIADLIFEPLIRVSAGFTAVYEELNRFPSVERDLAIVIDETTSFEDIKSVVIKSGGEWLTQLQVFDIYKNADQLGKGKMSVALRFTIENKEATLSDKELEQWFLGVQKALNKGVGAEIRR
jgi:phenylalanyl-tRNA synthetase beta chain